MAVMVKVEKRGTDTKSAIKAAAKILNRKLKNFLYFSLFLNVVLTIYILLEKLS
jgi:hypothetical protein